MKKLRCAVYTRKSTEEGLDMAFNSLDAQREACEAYVRSQKAEGWVLDPAAYDDGGFSGGNMDRPALARLLDDVRTGRIDIIVVYKVDRLSRSLSDFAKIVDILDTAGASFVSVTQAFNTTNSMGRLTLNVLLSFAQFEREVIAERVRDKIAASKAKGIWMGGPLALGYAVDNRRLVPVENEAATVRHIYARYLALPSARALLAELHRDGIVTKRNMTKSGPVGGIPFRIGSLYHLLANPIFIGKIRHHEKIYDGQHEGIVPQELWDAVQQKLAAQSADRTATGAGKAFLTGLIKDERGRVMSPTHATKKGRRYRYYASNISNDTADNASGSVIRVSQKVIHDAVRHAMTELFSDRSVIDLIDEHGVDFTTMQSSLSNAAELRILVTDNRKGAFNKLLRQLAVTVTVGKDGASATLDRTALRRALLGVDHGNEPEIVALLLPVVRSNRGRPRKLILGAEAKPLEPDPRLVRILVRGHLEWRRAFASESERPNVDQVRLARFATLAPDITAAILEGRQPASLNSRDMLRIPSLPMDWGEQRRLMGFGEPPSRTTGGQHVG